MSTLWHRHLLLIVGLASIIAAIATPAWAVSNATKNKQAYQKMFVYVCGKKSAKIFKSNTCPLLKKYQKKPTAYNEIEFIKSVCVKDKTVCQIFNKNNSYSKITKPHLKPTSSPSVAESKKSTTAETDAANIEGAKYLEQISTTTDEVTLPEMGKIDPEKELYSIPFGDFSEEKLAGFDVIINNQTPNKFAVENGMESVLNQVLKNLPNDRIEFVKTIRFVVGPGFDCNVASIGGMYDELNNIIRVCASDVFATNLPAAFHLALHEVAHAYQYQKLGRSNSEVESAFTNAIFNGLYAEGETGLSIEKGAYASYSPQEYFAELSSIYFGSIEYYPYNRMDLAKYDPVGYAMIEKVWNLSEGDFNLPEYNFDSIDF